MLPPPGYVFPYDNKKLKYYHNDMYIENVKGCYMVSSILYWVIMYSEYVCFMRGKAVVHNDYACFIRGRAIILKDLVVDVLKLMYF